MGCALQMNTHMAVGDCLGMVISMTQPPEYALSGVCSAMIGAILPDIDVGEAGRRWTPTVIGGISVLLLLLSMGTSLLPAAQPGMSSWGYCRILRFAVGGALLVGTCIWGRTKPHRTFMHSLPAMGILCLGMHGMLPEPAPYFAVGFASHLLLDMTNYRPVKLFYPFGEGVSLKLCYSNSRASRALLLVSAGLFALMVVIRTV